MSNVNWPEFWQDQIASSCSATLDGAVIDVAKGSPEVLHATDEMIERDMYRSNDFRMLLKAVKADGSTPASPTKIDIGHRSIYLLPYPKKGIVTGCFVPLGPRAVVFILAKESVLIVIGSLCSAEATAPYNITDIAVKVQQEAESRM